MIATRQRNGFTLVELSIVLVIIGLVVGGIVMGQAMYRSAQFAKIGRDAQKYKTAVNTFKLKYGQLPGDYDRAYENFGITGCVSAFDCNGNNNGYAGKNDTWPQLVEFLAMWRDLSYAKLIDLPVPADGRHSMLGGNAIPGRNVPRGAIEGSGFCYYPIPVSGNLAGGMGYLYVGDYSTFPSSSSCLSIPAPTKLWNNEDIRAFDTKFDDGVASSGEIRGADGYWGHCVAGGTTTSDYEATSAAWSNCMIAYYNPW